MTPPPAELAPSPPGVEVCSCEEALALRAEVARLTEALAVAEGGTARLRARVALALVNDGSGEGLAARIREAILHG